MKLDEKQKALQLRQSGASITLIAQKLGVSKGSVSKWVKDVTLSDEVLQLIKARSHSAASVEKRRSSRLLKENARRNALVMKAQKDVLKLNKRELFYLGVALYWGEGSKRKRGVVEFTNSDPKMIAVMKHFFDVVCQVPRQKYRGHVHLHSHLDVNKAEQYWSKVSGIQRTQFHKTSIQKNKVRVHQDTLPYGTFSIVICDTTLKLSIDGWIEGVYLNVTNNI